MRVVRDRSDEVVAWAQEHMPGMFGRPFRDGATGIGVALESGDLIGAVIFHDFFPEYGTIQASTAATDARWLRCRALYDAIFSYAFETCGCHKIWAATPRSNARALRMLRAFGMKGDGILHHQFGMEDAIISCKFKWDWLAARSRLAPDNAADGGPADTELLREQLPVPPAAVLSADLSDLSR